MPKRRTRASDVPHPWGRGATAETVRQYNKQWYGAAQRIRKSGYLGKPVAASDERRLRALGASGMPFFPGVVGRAYGSFSARSLHTQGRLVRAARAGRLIGLEAPKATRKATRGRKSKYSAYLGRSGRGYRGSGLPNPLVWGITHPRTNANPYMDKYYPGWAGGKPTSGRLRAASAARRRDRQPSMKVARLAQRRGLPAGAWGYDPAKHPRDWRGRFRRK